MLLYRTPLCREMTHSYSWTSHLPSFWHSYTSLNPWTFALGPYGNTHLFWFYLKKKKKTTQSCFSNARAVSAVSQSISDQPNAELRAVLCSGRAEARLTSAFPTVSSMWVPSAPGSLQLRLQHFGQGTKEKNFHISQLQGDLASNWTQSAIYWSFSYALTPFIPWKTVILHCPFQMYSALCDTQLQSYRDCTLRKTNSPG